MRFCPKPRPGPHTRTAKPQLEVETGPLASHTEKGNSPRRHGAVFALRATPCHRKRLRVETGNHTVASWS